MNAPHDNGLQSSAKDKTFIAMLATYALGVFNDNFFKQAAMLIAISAGLSHLQGTATTLFALPFLLFSAQAGWLADRFPKKSVVVSGKLLEIIAMLTGALGIITTNWACILAMVFLMGLQSTLFGPALNGAIPEHFAPHKVNKVNATLKTATTTAILLGIAGAGLGLDIQGIVPGTANTGHLLIAGIVVLVSIIGLLAGLGIRSHSAAAPDKPFPWAGPFHSLRIIWSLRKDRQLLLAIGCDTFFYFLASLVLLILNTLGITQLGLSQSTTSLLSVALMLGVALGSMAAAKLTSTEKWRRVLIPAATGMGCSLLLATASASAPEGAAAPLLFAALLLTGCFGGIFLIPITSFIQIRPKKKNKGEVIAACGFCSFTGILLAGQIYAGLDGRILPSTMMLSAAYFCLSTAAIYMMQQVLHPEVRQAIFRFAVQSLLRLRYRIDIKGLDIIQDENNQGGILFVANHPALIDPVILTGVLHKRFHPRPLASREQTNAFYLRPFIRFINAIRIPDLKQNGRKHKQAVKDGIEKVAKRLRQGDNILFYPSGQLYRSRQEDLGAKSGLHTILKKNPHQRVVLIRTSGLWGSSFSWASGRPTPLKHWMKYFSFLLVNSIFFGPRRHVSVEFTEQGPSLAGLDRLTLNRTLEQFYNEKSLPNTFAPYFHWQGNQPVYRKEPEGREQDCHIETIPETIRKRVYEFVTDITGVAECTDKDQLGRDIGMDSLAIMELMGRLEVEFSVTIDDQQSIHTMGDLLLAANGQLSSQGNKPNHSIPSIWFKKTSEQKACLPRQSSITEVFLNKAASVPGQAIIADQISGVKTYRQCITATMIMTKWLSRLKGRNLGIMLPASTAAALSYFSTLFAEKVPVMLNWTVGIKQLKSCLETAGITHIVTAKRLSDTLKAQGIDLEALNIEWLYLEEIQQQTTFTQKALAFCRSYTSWSSLRKCRVPDTAALLFTSGSEAAPKAVPLSHANILANLKDFTDVLSLQQQDRLLGILPPFHSLGLAGTVIMPLCLGLKTSYYPNPTEGTAIARLIEQYKSTLLIGTPTFVNTIFKAAGDTQLSSLRLLFTGAEKCPQYVYEKVASSLPGAVLCEGYGITECSPVVSVNTPDATQPGSIGRVLPTMEHIIIDPHEGQPVAPGKKGILLVRGANVFSGYIHDKQETPFVKVAGKSWYNTGDLVREDQQGFLYFCGRIKRFIKLGGEMISLPAIETALQHYFPATAEGTPSVAVEATPCAERPQIVLFTTLSINREEVNRFIREAGLSTLHSIRQLIHVDAIPVLGTGKIDYQQLKTALA